MYIMSINAYYLSLDVHFIFYKKKFYVSVWCKLPDASEVLCHIHKSMSAPSYAHAYTLFKKKKKKMMTKFYSSVHTCYMHIYVHSPHRDEGCFSNLRGSRNAI